MTFDDTPSRSLLTELCAGRLSLIWSMPDGSLQRHRPADPQGILCGSFDPLHVGHRALRDAAEARLQRPLFYEMTVFNADKPPLDEPRTAGTVVVARRFADSGRLRRSFLRTTGR